LLPTSSRSRYPLMSALFVNDVRRNHELPARIRRCRELLDVGDVLSARRREARWIPSAIASSTRRWLHRTSNGKIRSRVAWLQYSFQLFCRWMFRPGSFCSNFSQFAKELS
jgi:hypothetical protein